jgi:CubicO group peptidase (beta-lactamase class C family)
MRVIDTNPPLGLSAGDAPGLNTVAADGEITIQDLLTHKAGLGCGPASLGEIERLAPAAANGASGEMIASFGHVPLEHQPGDRWCYSPYAATETLLRIIETASSESTGQFFSRQIFQKLGMNATSVEYAPAASPHELGHHEVVASAEDIVKFGLMLLNRGEFNGVRLLGSRTFEMIRYPYVKEFDSPLDGRRAGRSFGLGMQVVNDPNAAGYRVGAGTFGWTDDHRTTTHFWVDPTEHVVGVVLIAGHCVMLVRDIEGAVLQAIVD